MTALAAESALPPSPLATASSRIIQTASWRTFRPVIDAERCTRCEVCWKFCPDLAIVLDPEGWPSVELAHCKGCGICAEECRPGAIRMVQEEA